MLGGSCHIYLFHFCGLSKGTNTDMNMSDVCNNLLWSALILYQIYLQTLTRIGSLNPM